LSLLYTPQSRPERLIAAGRVVLAGASLFAVWLDPSEPVRHAGLAYSLLALYLGYAALVAVVLPRLAARELARQRLVTHVLDLSFFSLFVYFTAGPASPFTVYFVFSLVCASLRWGWRGTLATAGVALSTFVGLGVYFAAVIRDPSFELQSFIIRGVYLVVIAVLLGYLGAHEQQTRREISLLASWPPVVSPETRALARELARHAADVVGVPQALVVWNDADEPWVHLACWHRGAFTYERQSPAALEPLIHPELAARSFLGAAPAGEDSSVSYRDADGYQPWRGRALHPLIEERCAPGSVLALPLRGETFEGRLLLLGKPQATVDDLALGEVVAGLLSARLDQAFLVARLQERTAMEQRIRLARDLHDGVLQSLTGIALRLAAVRRLLDHEPAAAQRSLEELQRLIALEQRDLRFYIQELKPSSSGPDERQSAAGRLGELAERVGREWDLQVELHGVEALDETADAVGQDVYLIVREAVVNAVRHGGASRVAVRLAREGAELTVSVADNGRGFPFAGSFSGEALLGMGAGPRSLLERVSSLGGSLLLESGSDGARLDVRLPPPEVA
jgi:signal transduction histidine kinase